MDSGFDGASRLKYRLEDLINYISKGELRARHTKEIKNYMLFEHGISPKTTAKYLRWLEDAAKIVYTNRARNRVRAV